MSSRDSPIRNVAFSPRTKMVSTIFGGYVVFFGSPHRMGGVGDFYPPMSSRDSPIRNVGFGPRTKMVIVRVVLIRRGFTVLVRNTIVF
eukprot:SAG31_NODE_2698_length_5225_cov_11.224542_1_plen_88_part_00